jgi:hypothetical protein
MRFLKPISRKGDNYLGFVTSDEPSLISRKGKMRVYIHHHFTGGDKTKEKYRTEGTVR